MDEPVSDCVRSRPSHFQGDRSPPLIETTIGEAFHKVAKRHGDRIALVVRHQQVRWTYGDLKSHVNEFAAGLSRLGLQPGDRIGIWAPNCVEWTVTQYAAAKIGLILVNLNPAYRATEIAYALTKVGCKALVFAHHFKDSEYLEILRAIAPEIARSHPANFTHPLFRNSGISFASPMSARMAYCGFAMWPPSVMRQFKMDLTTGLVN